jgi:hypothetical protein
MKHTNNYNLKKPEGTDPVKISDLNDNMDIVDDVLKANADNIATKETPAGAQSKANAAENAAKAYTDIHEQKVAPHSGHETPSGAQSKANAAENAAKAYTDIHEQKVAPHSGHETPSGAQSKANAAENAAKAYTDIHEQKVAPHSGHETPSGAQAKVDALAGEGNTKTVKELDDELASHKEENMPHQFIDHDKNKTYKYGISQKNGYMVFNYQEVE